MSRMKLRRSYLSISTKFNLSNASACAVIKSKTCKQKVNQTSFYPNNNQKTASFASNNNKIYKIKKDGRNPKNTR